MRFLVRLFFTLLLLAALGAGVAWYWAGRIGGPPIEVRSPEKYVGISTPLEVRVAEPAATLARLEVVLEQGDQRMPVFSMANPDAGGTIKPDGDGAVVVTREIGRQTFPDLKSGPAKIVVTAASPRVRGIRTVESTASRDVEVRLERPRVSVLSSHHYVNLGGSEMIVYRVTPDDVESGVVVGDVEYPGFPAKGATVDGVSIDDPSVRVAFYALLYDQDVNTPMRVYARDEAGNTARADFDYRTFPKPFKRSTIAVDDRFLNRVVPAILDGTREINPDGDIVAKFVAINSELRQKNAAKIASFAKETAPEMLWRGVVFHPFTNSAVESAFADHRTYTYNGKEIDRQVHLGFDLASIAGNPIVAANRGKVLYAEELGIYGNCVIIDHGMGVQSLYAHLSSIAVQAGQMVDKEQELGRSGMTGLAGGDHLHFTMLVNGHMVNPVEWWDSHWIQDRILRKLQAAGGTAPQPETR
jgi:hypothetical protein